ncbi:MAG: PEGA domain-containing protein, partial [Deltaproteobacteria bacterium]|nr:PEGA domain-containing protein [Deltaproteobacteria bacterium]
MKQSRIRFALLLLCAAILTVVSLAPTPAHAQSPAARAQKHLVEGERAARAKQWDKALQSFQKAHEAQPSGAAATRRANALYQLERLLEAKQAYEALLKDYDKTLFQADKTKAKERLEELKGKLGSLTLRVSEKDATVLVDDEPVGTSPLPSPLPLKVGDHDVVVKKGGFETYRKTVQVSPGGATTVEVLLQALATVGQVKVT